MKKTLIIALIIMIIVALPFVLLSNTMLGILQGKIDNSTDKIWAANWQLRLGTIYRWTFRVNRGADAYRNFMERYPSDSRYSEAKLGYAYCLEQSSQKEEAAKEYTEFGEWYPDHPEAETARRKALRLKYGY